MSNNHYDEFIIDDILAVLSHEILSPATSIYADAELLLHMMHQVSRGVAREDFQWEKAKSILADIMSKSVLQMDICKDMTRASSLSKRPPSEKYSKQRPVRVEQLLSDVKSIIINHCRMKRLRFDSIWFDLHPSASSFPILNVDSSAFERLFLNVISNAVKYASDEPSLFRVFITCKQVSGFRSIAKQKSLPIKNADIIYEDGFVIEVRDNGVGISPEFADRVFDRYFRVPEVALHTPVGAGLGLSVVKEIVEDHFGFVWVEKLSKPTIISLFLPKCLETNAYTENPLWMKCRG